MLPWYLYDTIIRIVGVSNDSQVKHLAYHCCAEITGPKECCLFGKVKCVRATENGSQFLRIPHNYSFGVKKEEATTIVAFSKEK